MRLFSLASGSAELVGRFARRVRVFVARISRFHLFTGTLARSVVSFSWGCVFHFVFSFFFFPLLFYHLPESSSFFFFGLLAGVVRQSLRFLRCFDEISAAAATF